MMVCSIIKVNIFGERGNGMGGSLHEQLRILYYKS